MRNIWLLIALMGLCVSCTGRLDVPAGEYISFRYPFFETIHFEQDKVFLTQYMPEIQGNTLLLSAQQGRVSDYERSEDSFFLESPIAPEGTGTLLTLKGNGEILGYGDRDYYSPTIPETESISYDTFSGEITFSEFWNQGSLSAPLNTELLELLENSKLVRIDELGVNVELVKIIYSLSKEEFNESRTHYSDDLGIGYISSTVFLPIEGFPSIFYNLTGNGDYTTATTYMITSAESTLSFEEISITQESVFHARHIVKQDLTGFSDSSDTLLTEAEWDQEIDRLKLEAQERAVAEETARLEALEQERLAAEAEEAARLEALEQQRLVAEAQEQRRLAAEAEAAAEKQETALRALAPALALLDYVSTQEIARLQREALEQQRLAAEAEEAARESARIEALVQEHLAAEAEAAAEAARIERLEYQRQPPYAYPIRSEPSEFSGFDPEMVSKTREIFDYVDPPDGFVPDFIKGEELVSQLYEDFYENAANDEKRWLLGTYANIYLAQDKYPEAIQIFEQILTLEQLREADQPFLNYSLGQLHVAEENWQESINSIEQWREDSLVEEEVVLRQLAFAYFKLEQPVEALVYWLAAESMQVGNTSISPDILYYLATFPEPELLSSTFDYLLNTQQAIQDIREYGSLLEYQTTELNLFAQDLENPDFVARISQMQASTVLLNTSGTDRIGEYSPSTDISPMSIEWLRPGDPIDGDYLPLLAIAPQYPTRAAQRGIQGWCLVSFTVDGLGNVVEDTITIVDAEPAEMFDRSSTRAAARFKFRPRTFRGEGIPVPGIQYLFRFSLED